MSSEFDPCFVIGFFLFVGLLIWCVCAFVKSTLRNPSSTRHPENSSDALAYPDRDWEKEMENVYQYGLRRETCALCDAPLLIMIAFPEERCDAFKVCSEPHDAFQRKVCYENDYQNLSKSTDRLIGQPHLEHMPDCLVAEVIRQKFPGDEELFITGNDPNGNLVPPYSPEVPLTGCVSSHLKTRPIHAFENHCAPQTKPEDTWHSIEIEDVTCHECLSMLSRQHERQ